MRILFINSVCGVGSTGNICCNLAEEYEKKGYECKIAYGRGNVQEQYTKYAVKIGNIFDLLLHVLMTRVFDMHGLWSRCTTKKFIKWAESYNPDVLWLHNIHGYYINYEILFRWIKSRPNMKVKWTLHDCWSFTGHCSHFTYIGCNKWKSLTCSNCPQKREYPQSILRDNSANNIRKKKIAFTGVKNLEIITPSEWLKNNVRKSFLSEYKVNVVRNKFDKDIFKHINSNLKQELGITDKKILLSVSSKWTDKKGINDIYKLINMLGDEYVYIIIGLDDKQIKEFERNLDKSLKYIDLQKNQQMNLHNDKNKDINIENVDGNLLVDKNVYSLYYAITGKYYVGKPNRCRYILNKRLESKQRLVEYYSITDYFINPTLEDTYPSVNVEARMCGAKIISYNTGGCRETLINEI